MVGWAWVLPGTRRRMAFSALTGRLSESAKWGEMSVGLETRTRIGVFPIGVGSSLNAEALRLAAGCTLAGAPTWPLWPGGVRHVQRESVNATRLFSSRFLAPGCRPVAGAALEGQTRKHTL
jgi:hypothetical protein